VLFENDGNTMRKAAKPSEFFEELEEIARDTTDIRPMSRAAHGEWEAAKRTGSKVGRRQSKTKRNGLEKRD